MKKVLIIFICLLIKSPMVKALECQNYLTELNIVDYIYTPKFNKYNNNYSIIVPANITKLDITYTLESPNSKVTIFGNNPLEDEITIVLNCDTLEERYNIYVNKEEEQAVIAYQNVSESKISTKTKAIVIVLLSLVICFIIFCIKSFIFSSKKS